MYSGTDLQRCLIVNERGHWVGEDIDLWQLVVKIRRQWAALYGGDMTRRGINEISRLCWRPNTSMLAPSTSTSTSTQLGGLFAALLLENNWLGYLD